MSCELSSFVCVCVCVRSEGPAKGAKTGGGGGGEDDELAPSRLDIRVGKVISVEKVGRQDPSLDA